MSEFIDPQREELAKQYKLSMKRRYWIIVQGYKASSNAIEQVFKVKWGKPFRQTGQESKEKAILGMAIIVDRIKKLVREQCGIKIPIRSEVWEGWQIFHDGLPCGTKFDKGPGKKGKTFPIYLYNLPPAILWEEEEAYKVFYQLVDYWQDMKLKEPLFPGRAGKA